MPHPAFGIHSAPLAMTLPPTNKGSDVIVRFIADCTECTYGPPSLVLDDVEVE
ncbi:MAG: hypothetical protein ABUL62_00850 [Myxococcales bacterium]